MFRKTSFTGLALALALILGLGAPARAQFGDVSVYGALGAGVSVLEEFDITEDTTDQTFSTVPFPGVSLNGAVGLDFGLARLEGELLYDRHSLEDLEVGGLDLDAGGRFETLAGMLNAFVDLPTGIGITPFAGAGIGFADVEAKNIRIAGADLLDDRDTGLAWQLRAGVAFGLLPLTDLTFGYRYFVVEALDMANPTGDVAVEELRSHVVELGIRITF